VLKVEHEPAKHRFAVHLPEGEGELVYAQPSSQVLDLVHTGVQPTLKGRGVGDALVQAAVAYARDKGMRIVPTCPYVQHWLKSHPEAQDLVVRD
jgi:uncharacterized protein